MPLYVLSKSKRLRSLRSQICLYGPNQTMSSQDGLTGQLKDSPAREISDSLLFNDGWGGREGLRLELFCCYYSSLCQNKQKYRRYTNVHIVSAQLTGVIGARPPTWVITDSSYRPDLQSDLVKTWYSLQSGERWSPQQGNKVLDRIITIGLGQLSLSDQLRRTTISATNKRFNFHNGPRQSHR